MRNLACLGLVCLSSTLLAQSSFEKRYEKTAQQLFDAGAYAEVIPMYLSLLQQSYDTNINLNLAEAYAQSGNTVEAAHWYEVYLKSNPGDAAVLKKYADLLKKCGRYRLAKEAYLAYATVQPDGYYLAGTCDFALNNLDEKAQYLVEPLGINSTGSDIAPVFYGNGLLFASNGDLGLKSVYNKTDPASGFGFYLMYYVPENNTGYPASVQLLKDLNSDYHNASAAFDVIREQVYITRSNFYKKRARKDKAGSLHLQIYTGLMDGLSVYKLKPFDWNSKSYSTAHPCLSANGDLLMFVSDMPGGFGGTDIYYTTYMEGEGWSEPQNIGTPINTPGNEVFPYIGADGTLYFSSDYHPGFGGLDIFSTTRSNGVWTKPENPGLPLNSSSDDFGLILRQGTGYFSSDRPGGSGSDDLYRVAFLKPVTTLQIINGAQKSVANAEVVLYENDHRIEAGVSNDKGFLTLPIEENHIYTVEITKEGYFPSTLYNLDQYRSSTGHMQVRLLEMNYDTYETDTIETEYQYDTIPEDVTETESDAVEIKFTYELFIGAFKSPDYTRITPLARFGELSVRVTPSGQQSFYLIYLTEESSKQALEAAIQAGFSSAEIIIYENGIPRE